MRSYFGKCWARAVLCVVLIASFAVRAQAQGAADPNDPAANDPVEKAIRKAVQYIYSQQKGDHWEATPRRMGMDHAQLQWGGVSAMAVYGLLAAGENPQKPELARAIKFMDEADVIGTYAMGMKLQQWNYFDRLTENQKKVLKKDAVLMMNGVNGPGKPSQGLYHYSTTADGTYDMSTSNYGVLGMWAAAQQNLEIPKAYWELVDAAYRKQQNKDGGWQYTGTGGPSTLSMTSAGVATLFITQDMLNNNKGECKGNIVDADLERGLEWLSKNINAGSMGNLYSMYNIERVGTASGYKYFGTTDWYKVGADWLVKRQAANGSWAGGHGGGIPGTVWGLVFLIKGRAPVMMNKLEYAVDLKGDKGQTNWNQRPRDIANLARWAGKTLEKELNWQIVNLKVDIEDLHDAPVLYMAGNQAIMLKPEEEEKLRQFVEGGGLILGHADCNDQKFSMSFQKLGQKLFPYEFRQLPQDHLIYSAHFKIGPNKPVLRGMSNGARELMVLIPATDPARFWQIQNFSGPVMKQMSELATNVYLYAADKNTLKSKFKGQGYIVKKNEKATAGKTVKVARLEYGGVWNPEPGGWRRMSNIMHNAGTGLEVTPVKLGEGKLNGDFKVAHLTGTVKFKLNDAQRKELVDFVNNGGTLLVDAAGGVTDFKDAAEAELTAMFKSTGTALPPTHAVYAAGGPDMAKATYRTFAKNILVGGMNTPRLRGIEVNNRTAVLYSAEDLSVGLVGMTMDGIYGYTPEYATKVVKSVLTFAANGGGNKVAAADAGAAAAPAAATAAPANGKVAPAAAGEKMDDEEMKKPAVTKKGGPAVKK